MTTTAPERLLYHSLEDLLALDIDELEALWELVPTDRQRRYKERLDREVRLQGAQGADATEKQVVDILLQKYEDDALVPVGARWARAPQRLQDAVRAGDELDLPHEELSSGKGNSATILLLIGAGVLVFVCLLIILLTRGGGEAEPTAEAAVNAETLAVITPTPRRSPTPTPIALLESDDVIRLGDTDRALAYPIGLQVLPGGVGDQQPRVFIVQRRRVALAEWDYDANPDTASFISDLPIQLVIGIPYSEDNTALFEALDHNAIFVLRQNTGGELRFAFEQKQQVRRSDTRYFRQLGPGLVLVLIGERDEEGLPTRDRWIITATYLAEQELSREGVLWAAAGLPTAVPTPTPIATATPLPAAPRELLHVSLISIEHERWRQALAVTLRIYNNQTVPVTVAAEDFRLALGFTPNPPGPWTTADQLVPLTILPGQAADLVLYWRWQGEPYGTLEMLAYRFAVEFDQ